MIASDAIRWFGVALVWATCAVIVFRIWKGTR